MSIPTESLKRIHSDEVYARGVPKINLAFLRRRSTNDIIASLAPGEKEALRVKKDGRIFNGNTRIKILVERGIDVDKLPREILKDDDFHDTHVRAKNV